MQLPQPESEWLRRLISVGVALLAAAAVAVLYLRLSEWRGALNCGAAYATAYTASDTAAVDAQRSGATTGGVDDTSATGSCGALRFRGTAP